VKILYHHRTRSKDGQNVHIEELVAALRRRGHEIVVVGPRAMENEDFGADAGLVATLKRALPGAVYEILEFGYSIGAYLRLRRAYLRHRPDCLYERYNLFLPSGAWLKRRYRLPMLSEVNSPLVEERARFGGLFFVRFATWLERYVWRSADRVLPVTAVLASYVRRQGVPDDRIVVVPNGVNVAAFSGHDDREAAKRKLGLSGRTVLGFTGFIRSWHRLERVIDVLAAADAAPDLHFLVVGEGPARRDIEDYAAARGVADRVTFAGLVARDRVPDYVAAFDIALQSDVVSYASPLKLFEYMVLGCAIAAPDAANIREVLSHEENALLFDTDDDEAFRGAVTRLCRDAALRDRLGRAARQLVLDRPYTWDNNALIVETLFRRVLERAAPPA